MKKDVIYRITAFVGLVLVFNITVDYVTNQDVLTKQNLGGLMAFVGLWMLYKDQQS